MSDNHHASAEGQKSEQRLRNQIESLGLTFLRDRKDIGKYLGVAASNKKVTDYQEGRTLIKNVPAEYEEAGYEYFKTDGFIPELNLVIEQKHGTKAGTTQEKIFFDLEKIADGIYDGYQLIYVFTGHHQCNDKSTKLFEKKLSRLNKTNVRVLKLENIEELTLENLNGDSLI